MSHRLYYRYDRRQNLFLDLEPEVTETAAEGLPLRGSQMDAILRGPTAQEVRSVLEFLAVGKTFRAFLLRTANGGVPLPQSNIFTIFNFQRLMKAYHSL